MDTFVGHQTNIDNIFISANCTVIFIYQLTSPFMIIYILKRNKPCFTTTCRFRFFDACFDILVWFCRR
jgi:hypothetical protein